MAQMFRLERVLIRVSGPDHVGFLQNLLTQDVEQLQTPRYGALLSPQGKVTTDMMLWPSADAIVIETSPSHGDDLLRRLTLYQLRAQVTLEQVNSSLSVAYSETPFDGATADPRLPNGALGWRRLTPHADTISLPDGAPAHESRRLALGVPDLAHDAQPEEVFAGEALLEELHGVDFQKGCFIGQENVSRMKRRATTRKKFCPIVFDGPTPAFGAAIKAGDAEIGTVRTGMLGRAIALLRLDRATEASENGVPLAVDGREIRLDPPDWLIMPQREDT